VLLVDDVYTLTDVVIGDSTRIDLISWTIIFHGVVAIVATQASDDIYHDQLLVDMFLLLVVKVFKCLD